MVDGITLPLVELLKGAETLKDVFDLFKENECFISRNEFREGRIISVREDYAILDELAGLKPEIEAVHPYGTDTIYFLYKKTE